MPSLLQEQICRNAGSLESPYQAVGRGNTPAQVRLRIARRRASSAIMAARSSSVGSFAAPSSPLPVALAKGRSPAIGRYTACTRFAFLSQRRSLRKSGGISELSILRRVVRGESMCVGKGRLYGYGISIGCGYIGALVLLLLPQVGSEVLGTPVWVCSGYGGGGDSWQFESVP